MKLLIVARTCSRRSVVLGQTRIVDCSREEMILKCIDSLIKSANNAAHDITIKILDDHSDEEFLEKIKMILEKSKHPVLLRSLEETGFNHSAYEQFKEGYYADSMVYFVEDDYFHTNDAISSMIEFMESDVANTNIKFNMKVVHPYDCPHRYWPTLQDPALIFYQGNRYWRTLQHTSNTIMLHSSAIQNFWNIFENLALNYPNVKEHNTINLLYSNLVTHGGPIACFSPIPSVAYHISYENEPPNDLTTKFTNWKEEWNQYEWN